MGYQEKRVWILFTTETLLYGTYFWVLHHHYVDLGQTLYLILALIVLQVALQALLAMDHNPERRDERDRLIESRGFRVGYFVLLGGLACMIAAIAHRIGFSGALTAGAVINTLLFATGVAELSKLLTQISLYRRTA